MHHKTEFCLHYTIQSLVQNCIYAQSIETWWQQMRHSYIFTTQLQKYKQPGVNYTGDWPPPCAVRLVSSQIRIRLNLWNRLSCMRSTHAWCLAVALWDRWCQQLTGKGTACTKRQSGPLNWALGLVACDDILFTTLLGSDQWEFR